MIMLWQVIVTIKEAELLSQLRFSEGCKALFNQNTLCNLEIFSMIHHWLQNQGYKKNPETQIITREPIKVAHAVYCGAMRMAERSAAVDIINNVLKELRQNNQARQSANNTTTATQAPVENQSEQDRQLCAHVNTADGTRRRSHCSLKKNGSRRKTVPGDFE